MAWDVSGKPIGGQNGPVAAFHRLFAKETTPIEQQKAMLAKNDGAFWTPWSTMPDRCSVDSPNKMTPSSKSTSKGSATSKRDWLRKSNGSACRSLKAPIPEPKPGIDGREEIKLIYDIMIAAMQTDSTRVMTFRQPVNTLLTALDIRSIRTT